MQAKQNVIHSRITVIISTALTDGLLGKPTRWPHVVSKLTRHSRTRPCDIHGRFQPLSCTASAGDKLALRRGEPSGPTVDATMVWESCCMALLAARALLCAARTGPMFESDLRRMRLPMSGVCEMSNENSIVRPASSCDCGWTRCINNTYFDCLQSVYYLLAEHLRVAEAAVVQVR